MPAPLSTREEILGRLLEVFRTHGFEGASLAEISAATGLGRSSLYHYFPGGKVDMARQVLAHVASQLETVVLEPLRGDGPPAEKLRALLAAFDKVYEGGTKACLLERLTACVEQRAFKRPLAQAFGVWQDAVEGLCKEAGLPAAVARARAEDFIVRIEGALVLSAARDDRGVWTRTIAALRSDLLLA